VSTSMRKAWNWGRCAYRAYDGASKWHWISSWNEERDGTLSRRKTCESKGGGKDGGEHGGNVGFDMLRKRMCEMSAILSKESLKNE
jgi:hypothetical protein